MPETTATDGTTVHYEITGAGETVVFLCDAGYGAWQWAWQHDGLTGPFQTLVWDLRGTGRSGSPPGPYTVEQLAADLEAVLAASDTDRAHLVGAGLGGMIALRYAREYGRARTLSLLGTAGQGDAVDKSALESRYAPPGEREMLRDTVHAAFSDEFCDEQPDVLDRICEWRQADDATRAGFVAQKQALQQFQSGPLYELSLPALVCHGVDDQVVPIEAGRELAAGLPRGEFEPVEGRHLCFIEHAQAVTDRLCGFLDDNEMA